MKRIVWLAAAVVLVAFIFPNGISLPKPAPQPAGPVTPVPVGEVDNDVVARLSAASREDKDRVVSAYVGLRTVMARDKGEGIKTTEKFAMLHARTLNLAIDTPGKYAGLDEAIEAVFARALGTDDSVVVTPEVLAKVLTACDIIVNSARK